MEYIKRYDQTELAGSLRQLGWEPVASWSNGWPFMMGLFRWQG
jgi:hypothetical protein